VGSPEEAAFQKGLLTAREISSRFNKGGISAYENSVLNVIRDSE
jgi:hypothetical protein